MRLIGIRTIYVIELICRLPIHIYLFWVIRARHVHRTLDGNETSNGANAERKCFNFSISIETKRSAHMRKEENEQNILK